LVLMKHPEMFEPVFTLVSATQQMTGGQQVDGDPDLKYGLMNTSSFPILLAFTSFGLSFFYMPFPVRKSTREGNNPW